MVPSVKRGRPAGAAANGRRILRELILTTVARAGGQARASSVLRSVRDAGAPYVPAEWHQPHPPYRSRIELYTAFERTTLRNAGLLDASARGIWKLTPAGWECARKLLKGWQKGSAKPLASPQQLPGHGNAEWIGRILGSMRDEPDFAEVVRLGRQIRRSQRPG